jgi:LysM repeat protein
MSIASSVESTGNVSHRSGNFLPLWFDLRNKWWKSPCSGIKPINLVLDCGSLKTCGTEALRVMDIQSLAAERPPARQPPLTSNGGGESFQLAYAKAYDGRYASPAPAPMQIQAQPPAQTQDATATAAQKTAAPSNTSHAVHAGDTLSRIARARLTALGAPVGAAALRDSIEQLARANHIRNPDRIYTGQKLDLSVLDASITRQQTVAQAVTVSAPQAPATAAVNFVAPAPLRHEVTHAAWNEEDKLPAEETALGADPVAMPAALPFASLPMVSTDGMAAIVPPSTAARGVALYEQNAAAVTDKPAEASRGLSDIVYKGVAGKVLDALPIEPSTRANLQRANSIVSSAFTARSLGALTGIGGPLVTVAGLLWGIFSSRQIEAAPTEAKPATNTNPVAESKPAVQTKVADALN